MAIEMQGGKLNLAVLISGRGSNLKALIESCEQQNFPARINVVISNCPNAGGLEHAQKAGIETETIDHKDHQDRESFEKALLETLESHDIDLICLAGFMRILTPYFIRSWENQIINIHPSLLPDYKGLDTHKRVIADGKEQSGCTVHYVVPEMDSGPIIVQKAVPVKTDDTVETLAARVLEQEHIAYPEAIKIIADKLLQNSHESS